MMRFGATIKKFREKAALTQKELADALQVTPTYLSAIEHERKQPSLDLLKNVSKVLGIPREVLFWESVDWDTGEEVQGKLDGEAQRALNYAKFVIDDLFKPSRNRPSHAKSSAQ
jgi:transcriptional regulator with XRE-family HTH domain